MKTLLFILGVIFLQGSAFANNRPMKLKCEPEYEMKNAICIDGEMQSLIERIYNDYSKTLKGSVKDIKYYNFVVKKEGPNEITIEIVVNNKKLMRDFGHMVKGGGGLYHYSIEKDEIVEKIYYK